MSYGDLAELHSDGDEGELEKGAEGDVPQWSGAATASTPKIFAAILEAPVSQLPI